MKVFLAVADAASFSAAGRALGVSKAMVSKHVAHLEDSLGVRLLQRSTRCMRLTEAGSTYQERCRRILADIDETERVVSALRAEPRGLLRVAAPTSLGSYHLAPALSEYTALFPQVQVRLILNDSAEDPIKERTDVVVRIGRLASSNLIARRIAEVRLVTCAARVYLERFGVPQIPGDLARHNCLIYTGGQTPGEWRFRGPDGEYGLSVTGDFEANVGEAVRMVGLRGQGLVQFASYVVQRDIDVGRLCAVLPEHEANPLPIHAVYADRCLPASVRTFVEFLEARFLGGRGAVLEDRAFRSVQAQTGPLQGSRAEVIMAGEDAPQAYRQPAACL